MKKRSRTDGTGHDEGIRGPLAVSRKTTWNHVKDTFIYSSIPYMKKKNQTKISESYEVLSKNNVHSYQVRKTGDTA